MEPEPSEYRAGWRVRIVELDSVGWMATALGVLASSAAPRSIEPRPWQSAVPAIDRAVDLSRSLTPSGVMSGRWSMMSATAPETTAAACDVPLPLKSP